MKKEEKRLNPGAWSRLGRLPFAFCLTMREQVH